MPLSLSIVWHPLSGYPGLALPHEAGEGTRFDCIGSTREFTATLPGLLHPHSDRTCSWTIGAQQGRVAWRYCSRWGVTPHRPRAPDGKALPFTLQRSTIPATTGIGAPLTSRHTRYVAIHPLRRDTPDQKGCNAYGSGAPPHRQQARTRIFSLAPPAPESNRPRPRSTAPDTAAMH